MLILMLFLTSRPNKGIRDSKFWKTLTRELYGKSRLADVEISLELNGDSVQCGVDPLREQRATELSQSHLILRWAVPDFEHVMTGLRVKGQELKAVAIKTRNREKRILSSQIYRDVTNVTLFFHCCVGSFYLTMFPESTSMVQVQRRLLS